jgi:hypothetical protein
MVSIPKSWNVKFVMGHVDCLEAPLVCRHAFLLIFHGGLGLISLQQKVSTYAKWFH